MRVPRLDVTDPAMYNLWLELDTSWTLWEFSEEYWKLRDADGRYLIHRHTTQPALMGVPLVFAEDTP